MSDTLVVDRNGRVYLPKLIRKLLGLGPNSLMEVAVDDDRVVLKKVDSVAEYGRGMFKRRDLNDPVRAVRTAASD
jgi:AbrB family looped-hinge helix DNA binding protein